MDAAVLVSPRVYGSDHRYSFVGAANHPDRYGVADPLFDRYMIFTVCDVVHAVVVFGAMKITVDLEKCIASGSCVVADPAVFDQREDDGLVVLLTDSPDPSHAASVRSASAACPARAILVED